jgi:acetyltransferase-like isoleucine patch superfamily enzyme
MDIGNRVVFSREVELAAHVRQKMDGQGSRVLVRPVRIGSYAFIGAGAHVGPGAVVPANANVPPSAVVRVNESFGDAVRHPERDEAEFVMS